MLLSDQESKKSSLYLHWFLNKIGSLSYGSEKTHSTPKQFLFQCAVRLGKLLTVNPP